MIPVKESDINKLSINKKIVSEVKKKLSVPLKEIDANLQATLKLTDAIKNISIPQDIQDLSPILEAIYKIQDTQKDIITTLLNENKKNKEQKTWKFSVERDGKGEISNVLAEEKIL